MRWVNFKRAFKCCRRLWRFAKDLQRDAKFVLGASVFRVKFDDVLVNGYGIPGVFPFKNCVAQIHLKRNVIRVKLDRFSIQLECFFSVVCFNVDATEIVVGSGVLRF